MVDPDGAWLDPHHGAAASLRVDADALLAAVAERLEAIDPDPEPTAWLTTWLGAERAARGALDALLDRWETPFEGRVARDVVAALPDGATLVVASSMPVRDVESFAASRSGLRIVGNRGVNGIDGFTSTALGIAAAGDAPVVALLGDLCFLHDTNGLLGAVDRGVDCTLVVVDNGGGGIFSFLPQADAGAVDPGHFEQLFATPHGVDLAALAAVHGIATRVIGRADELVPALTEARTAGGVRIVLVRTDRAENVARHRDAWAAVAAAVST
jgi:2-succinyl-5-enolpyruvyl-6-hydroxy-3-cyclohexene-1-carboxylate synthase